MKLKPLKRNDEWPLVGYVCQMARNSDFGLFFVEEPTYRLIANRLPRKLPHSLRLRSALLALGEAKKSLSLSDLVRAYDETYGDVSICPEFGMLHLLEKGEGRRFVQRRNRLVIGIRGGALEAVASSAAMPQQKDAGYRPIASKIDEKSLEGMLAGRLELLEPGLTLIQRQFSIEGVGRIDLLCRDRKKDLVVVEIKRPSAGNREVVGQIAAYIGWIRRNMAGPGQRVRGIIVVGKEDEKLRYSIEALENVSVRPFY